jgi:hypothetical protein
MRHIVPISGKDSLAAFLVQQSLKPDLHYELMFNPTGAETPEVDEWLNAVALHVGIPIQRIGSNLESIIDEQGILPSINARFCTRLAKIYPMEDWIGTDEATVYYGIRADEKRTGYINVKKPNIQPIYPLVTAGMNIDAVYELLSKYDLLPPSFFWKSMYEMVYSKLGDDVHLIQSLHPLQFRQIFAGRTRMNCSFCFFQRAYEWVWLLETHPGLFWHAVEMEESIGGTDYTWRYKQSLRIVAEKSEQIKHRRAQKIVKFFAPKQASMFDTENSSEDGDIPDLLKIVSCGLLCGK